MPGYPRDASSNPSPTPNWTGSAAPPSAPDGGNGPGYYASYALQKAESWTRATGDAAVAGAHYASSAVASGLHAANYEIQILIDRLLHSQTWRELESAVMPILGGISFDFGIAVGLADSVADLIKGLYQVLRMLVLAAIYEQITGFPENPTHSLYIEIAKDLSPGFLLSKLLAIGLGSSGLWPSYLQDMKQADDEVKAIIKEVVDLIRHPIDGIVHFTTDKWSNRWKSWQSCKDWYNDYESLYNSGEPRKMYDAGVIMGKLVGNIILTVLAILSAYGLAARAAQLAALGGRVALGLVTLEAAQAELALAEAVAAAASEARTAALATKDSLKIAEATKNATAAAERLKAARLQKTLAELKQRAPKLFEQTKNMGEQPVKESGGGGLSQDEAQASQPKGSSEEQGSKPVAKKTTTLDPNKVRFSQKSVSYLKKRPGGNYTYDDILNSMKRNGWNGDPVDVIKMPDGELTSMDNTRIAAAREAGIDVEANVHNFDDPLPQDMVEQRRFGDAQTWGQAITSRISNQSGSFGSNFPSGSPSPPSITGRPTGQ